MTELGANRYGKQSIRLVRVVRGPVHRVRDLTVDVALEGGFDAAFIDGDNTLVVATDTMKNTVYAFATEHLERGHRAVRGAARDALRRAGGGRASDGLDPRARLGAAVDEGRPRARRLPAIRRHDADRGRGRRCRTASSSTAASRTSSS